MISFFKRRNGTITRRKDAIAGLLFIAPWLIGTIFFFLRSFVMVFFYAFNEVIPEVGRIEYKFVGWGSFKQAFTKDTAFIRSFAESVGGILLTSVFVIFFSMFVALILNGKFRGRALTRTIFFLPVIIATGPILDIISGDEIAKLLMSGQQTSTMFGTGSVQDLLTNIGLPIGVVEAFAMFINGIFSLSWKSGIQILLFLAGLQNVPQHLYEAAEVEGASGWEKFWRITLPIITPILLLNSVYTLIDGFTDYTSSTVKLIVVNTQNLNLSYAASIGVTYFLIIFAFVILVYAIFNRKTFYMEK